MKGKHLMWLILLLNVFALGGCGGGNGDGLVPESSVSVESVEVLSTGDIHPRSTASLAVTLRSDGELKDLGMTYYLISKDEAAQRIESYHFGSTSIPVVSAGEYVYAQSFVFSDDVPAGSYNLIAQVDPLENVLTGDIVFQAPESLLVPVGDDGNLPDLVLQGLHLYSSYLALDHDEHTADNVLCEHVSGTIDVESVAYGATDVAVAAYVEVDGGYRQVQIWDSEKGAFEDYLTIPELDANTMKSILVDVLVPDTVRNRLEGETSTNLKLVLDPLDTVEENENVAHIASRTDDNEIIHAMNVYDGVPVAADDAGGLDFMTSYGKSFSNSNFGVGLDFVGEAWFGIRGIGASVSGSVPVTILGHTFDFLKATSDAHYNPVTPTDSAFDLDIEFAGTTLYSLSGNAGFSWSETWQISQRKGYSQTFVIAVVPVTVSAGASGTLGLKATINVDSAFSGTASPFVDVGAYASAAINLVVAQGGIRGDLSLVGCTFNANLGGSIAADAGATQLTGTLSETVGYTVEGPHGDIVVYVKWPKTCWKWHVIPYPCGWHEKDYSLVKWSSYSKSDTLASKQQSVTVSLK